MRASPEPLRQSPPPLAWAAAISRELLEPLGARWVHTLGVLERARTVGQALIPAGEADVLLAAAYLHDIGYATALQHTGFHPIDGARFLRTEGHERLARLVAHHTGARFEAGERGLANELAEFAPERSLIASALTYCDLTTSPEGHQIEPADRLAEITNRYGTESMVGRSIRRAHDALLADARTIRALLDERD